MWSSRRCINYYIYFKVGNRGENEEIDLELNHQNKDKYKKCEKKEGEDGDLFKIAESETVEQFMAVKPWIGALKAPSNRKIPS